MREGDAASTSAMKGEQRKQLRFSFGGPWQVPRHSLEEQSSCLFLHLKAVLRPCIYE